LRCLDRSKNQMKKRGPLKTDTKDYEYKMFTFIPLTDTKELAEERSFENMLKFSNRAITTP